jgi:hypothetical protein
MNDAPGVGGFESSGDINGNVKETVRVKRPVVKKMLKRDAIQKFHGDKSVAFVLADVMDGTDVRTVEGGIGLCFALESSKGLRIFGDLIGKEL